MKKLKNEKELLKKAITLGTVYANKRGVAQFEATDSAANKIEYIYRLLVHDKLIQPLSENQVSQPSMQHKLALWVDRQINLSAHNQTPKELLLWPRINHPTSS